MKSPLIEFFYYPNSFGWSKIASWLTYQQVRDLPRQFFSNCRYQLPTDDQGLSHLQGFHLHLLLLIDGALIKSLVYITRRFIFLMVQFELVHKYCAICLLSIIKWNIIINKDYTNAKRNVTYKLISWVSEKYGYTWITR